LTFITVAKWAWMSSPAGFEALDGDDRDARDLRQPGLVPAKQRPSGPDLDA